MNKTGTKTNKRKTKTVFMVIIAIFIMAATSCNKHDNTPYITELFIEKQATFMVGDVIPLTMFVNDAVLENTTLKWRSDNESVAIINDKGYVTGLSEGSATITCTAYKGEIQNDFLISFVANSYISGEYKGILLSENDETIDSASSMQISAICVDGIDFGFITFGLSMRITHEGNQFDIDCSTLHIWAENDKYRLRGQTTESENNHQSIVVGGSIDPRNSSIDLVILIIDWGSSDVNYFKFKST